MCFYYVTIPIYNGLLLMGYTSAYNNIAVFSLMIDEDVSPTAVMEYPPLYKTLQKGRSLSAKTFLAWVWVSIFQGGVIILCTLLMFPTSFANIATITFSALIMVELLDIHSCISNLTWMMIVATIFTVVIYIISIVLFKPLFDISYITWPNTLKIIALVLIAWGPIFLVQYLLRKFDPPEHLKIKRPTLK